ncbi:MAG TPA: UDP-N-acetylmuramoylalanyl-D-glutamyl-2,6-diaminopimelate--D-alanyl-D-alanine ligase [Paracoccaceae bacterium]|nr:UDP-N-acetylmuramoylalanyl-D-glutamyl-2,6-diaminopimelate--D-alanyl-D-alanine ligase [Paracoccaceae bacterium]
MTPLWTAAEAAAATGGEARGDWAATGVAIDTREMARGDLFVALTGEARDGHGFVRQALANGAAAAMVSRIPDGVAADASLLVVGDTLDALRRLGIAGRARTEARVIAVTGSVGKTSTKDMLRTMLDGQGSTHAATRSFNNHWGVPLTLARMPAATDYAVIEIGMNHAGEITPLTRAARPHVGLVTNVEAVHLEYFGSVEAIADAKAEIFLGLEPGGAAVLNADNAQFARLSAAAAPHEVVAFGRGAPDFVLESARVSGSCTLVRARIGGRRTAFKIGAPGAHFALNALGALAAVQAAGGDICRAALSLAGWAPPAGRGSRETIALGPAGMDGAITLLDESYNANPASMRAALAVLAASPVSDGEGRVARGRRVAMLGDMLELGPDEAAWHAGLAALPELDGIDRVHCCGPRMKALHDTLPRARRGHWFPDSAALAAEVGKAVDAGDVVMVKGSLGARMARVVEAIRGLGTTVPSEADEEA